MLLIFGPSTYALIRQSLLQRQLDRRMAEVSQRYERLTQERTQLESNPAYVEGLIRSTFKLAQPDEYVIPLDPESTTPPSR